MPDKCRGRWGGTDSVGGAIYPLSSTAILARACAPFTKKEVPELNGKENQWTCPKWRSDYDQVERRLSFSFPLSASWPYAMDGPARSLTILLATLSRCENSAKSCVCLWSRSSG